MPEINQYTFSHRELLELLIKKADVHEGKWAIMMSFGFSAGNFGPAPDQMSPGAIVVVTNVGIQRATSDAPEEIVLDAAVINPLPSKEARPAKEKRRAS